MPATRPTAEYARSLIDSLQQLWLTCRQDHKKILRLRSLITRGRARERLAATPAIKFILRRADNGVLWNILSFWRATE